MFFPGGCGVGDIEEMIVIFNLLSPTFEKLEMDIIWYEYGQVMDKLYGWTKYLEDNDENKNEFTFYFHFNKYMKRNWQKFLFKSKRSYVRGGC
jgi:hypothetical protein